MGWMQGLRELKDALTQTPKQEYTCKLGGPIDPQNPSAGTIKSISKDGIITVHIGAREGGYNFTNAGQPVEKNNPRSPLFVRSLSDKEIIVAPREYYHPQTTPLAGAVEFAFNFSSIIHDTLIMLEQSVMGSVILENEEGLIGRFIEFFAKKFVEALENKDAASPQAISEVKEESNIIITQDNKEGEAKKREESASKLNLFAAVKQYMTELLSASVEATCSSLAAQLMVPPPKSMPVPAPKPAAPQPGVRNLGDMQDDDLVVTMEGGSYTDDTQSYQTAPEEDNRSFVSVQDFPPTETLPEAADRKEEEPELPSGGVIPDLKYRLGQVLMQYLVKKDEHPEGLIGAIKEILEPIFKPIQELAAKGSNFDRLMGTFTETLTIVNNLSKKFLGDVIAVEQPRVPEAGGNPPRWVPDSSIQSSVIQPSSAEGEGQKASWIATQCKVLFETASSRIGAYLPTVVPYLAAYTFKAVVVQLRGGIQEGHDTEAFDTLIDLLDEVMGAEPKVRERPDQSRIMDDIEAMHEVLLSDEESEIPQEEKKKEQRCTSIGAAIDKFLQIIRERNIDITFNGFTFPMPNPNASDEAQYPCMVATKIARSAEERLEALETRRTGRSKIEIREISSNLSHYITARFIYELVAGLDFERTEQGPSFYKNLFNKACDETTDQLNETRFQEFFFATLDAAQARGEISAARVWIAKTVYGLMESFFALTLRPFGNRFNEILQHLMESRSLIEAIANLVLGNLAQYLGNLVEAQRSVGSPLVAGQSGYVAGSLEEAMGNQLNQITNEKMAEDERYRQAIENAVEQFGPDITWVNDLSVWLNGLRFEEESSLSFINPLIGLVMSVISSFAFVVLYLPQVVLNRGMRWTMKEVLIHTNVLSGVIEKTASTMDGDIHTQIAVQKMLQAFAHKVHDSMLNQQSELEKAKKNPSLFGNPNIDSLSAEAQNSPIAASTEDPALDTLQEKLFSNLVANLLDAMKYGNVDSREELRDMMNKRSHGNPGEDSSFLLKMIGGFIGIDLDNMQKVIDKETHKRMVQILMRSYRQALDNELIQQQMQEIMGMINSMFKGEEVKSEAALREELRSLKSSNNLIFSELIGFAIHNAIKEQFDTSGEAHRLAFKTTLESIKKQAEDYVASQKRFINTILEKKDKSEEEGKRAIKALLKEQMVFNRWIATFHANHESSKDKLQSLMTDLTKLSKEYNEALERFLQDFKDVSSQKAKTSLDKISKWHEEIELPKNINIRMHAEFMDFLLGLMKNAATRHAKDHVDKVLKLLTEPYNVAGILNNVFLIPFARKEFPFQQSATRFTPIKV